MKSADRLDAEGGKAEPLSRRAATATRRRSAASCTGDVRVGISGWRYAPWRGKFYPAGLPQRAELRFAASQVRTVEINGSFYSMQRPSVWQQWHDETPSDFVFAVKGPRLITHMKKLLDVHVPLANFFASGVLALRAKLGPILWQLPPNLRCEQHRLNEFLGQLPRDADAAHALAQEHDTRVTRTGAWLDPVPTRPLRHAIEVRHESFVDAAFVALLRRHGVALVVADIAGRWPFLEDVTADFVYVRLHGDEELYASGYGDAALQRWARRIHAWRTGAQAADARTASSTPARRAARRDVYCYFDNDIKVHAPFDARHLAALCADAVAPSSLDTRNSHD